MPSFEFYWLYQKKRSPIGNPNEHNNDCARKSNIAVSKAQASLFWNPDSDRFFTLFDNFKTLYQPNKIDFFIHSLIIYSLYEWNEK